MTPICALPSTPDFIMVSMDHTNRAPGEFCFLILHHNLTIKTGLLLEHSKSCPLLSLLVQVLCHFHELPPMSEGYDREDTQIWDGRPTKLCKEQSVRSK